jgi:hypothetical protein
MLYQISKLIIRDPFGSNSHLDWIVFGIGYYLRKHLFSWRNNKALLMDSMLFARNEGSFKMETNDTSFVAIEIKPLLCDF